MMLCEVTGEYERCRAITYNAAGNKAVYHYRMMRPVIGCVYTGEPEKDTWGNVYYTIYVRYPDVDVAMYVDKVNHWRTDEMLVERFVFNGYDTKERFIETAKQRIADGDHFRFTEVEFLKHVAPELEESAWESRKVYAERRARKDAERREKREAEDADYVERENSKSWDIVNSAVEVLRNGGTLENEKITFYKSRYDYKSICVINFLMDQYGIDLPIRTRGWINECLQSIRIIDGAVASYHFWRHGRSKGSTVLYDRMSKLLKAI